jgi:hypothetical protein
MLVFFLRPFLPLFLLSPLPFVRESMVLLHEITVAYLGPE